MGILNNCDEKKSTDVMFDLHFAGTGTVVNHPAINGGAWSRKTKS